MKFRKKPVVIDAIQWTGNNEIDVTDFVGEKLKTNRHLQSETKDLPSIIYIPTLEGVMQAKANDWIIKGVNGEFYPCKPDIFEKTYEPVEDHVPFLHPQ